MAVGCQRACADQDRGEDGSGHGRDNKIRIGPESEIFYPRPLEHHHRPSHIPQLPHHRPRSQLLSSNVSSCPLFGSFILIILVTIVIAVAYKMAIIAISVVVKMTITM